jgi:hypothetical protein
MKGADSNMRKRVLVFASDNQAYWLQSVIYLVRRTRYVMILCCGNLNVDILSWLGGFFCFVQTNVTHRTL